MMKQPTLHLNIAVSNMSTLKSTYSHQTVARLLNSNSTAGVRNSWRNIANKLHLGLLTRNQPGISHQSTSTIHARDLNHCSQSLIGVSNDILISAIFETI